VGKGKQRDDIERALEWRLGRFKAKWKNEISVDFSTVPDFYVEYFWVRLEG
jgi:hypothetical protein